MIQRELRRQTRNRQITTVFIERSLTMRIDRILCLCAVITLPQLASAEPQSDNQSQSMETVHAIIDFCAQVDPGNASKYQKQASLMFRDAFTGGHGREESGHEDEMDRDGKHHTHVNAYEQTRTALGKVSRQDAETACKGFLEPGQEGMTGLAYEQEGSHDMRTH
jgi:hypothetical protein